MLSLDVDCVGGGVTGEVVGMSPVLFVPSNMVKFRKYRSNSRSEISPRAFVVEEVARVSFTVYHH